MARPIDFNLAHQLARQKKARLRMREPLTTRDAIAIFAVIMAVTLGILGCCIGWAVYESKHKIPVDMSYLCPVTDGMRIFVTECKDNGYTTAECYYTYVDAVCYGSVKLEMPCSQT